MKYLQILLLTVFIPISSFTQEKININGNIKDGATGEDLIGAKVKIKELPGKGAISNVYGFYSLSIAKGDYTLIYSFVGFETFEKPITVDQDLTIDIELGMKADFLKTVVVNAEKEDDNITSSDMGVTKITPKDIETIPVLFGEKDIIKVMQLTPGVKSAGEGNSGFYVRGGGSDQNLILLDEAPVYNPSHLLGFFSVFNSDIVKDATLYKGAIPAQFGGRASSVLDIKMIDGNKKKFSAKGGIGIISSKLTLEAPIVKDKGSIVVSGRRTYADIFVKLSKDPEINQSVLYFYDLTAKANYKFGKKDRVFLSGYFGRDKLGFGKEFGFDWGNKTGTLRWNHIFGKKLFSNTSAIFSDYDYQIKVTSGTQTFSVGSLIRDINLKQDFTYYLNDNNTLKFGGHIIYHKFLPGNFSDGESNVELNNKNALESAVYLQNKHELSKRFSMDYGLRFSHFNYVGPSTKYEFDTDGAITKIDSTTKDWKSIQQYYGFEPRVSGRFQLDENSSLKGSYGRNYQYMHLLSNSTSSQPTDVWAPSTNNIKPLIVDQFSLGYFRNFHKNMYSLSVETYYKDMKNQLDYKDGASLFLNETVENQLVFGTGYAYGVELLFKKTKGKFTGWLGYTYSRSFKKIPEINNGKAYSAKQDRKHDISIVGMYSFTDRVKLAANWVYYTGNAVTFPSGKLEVNGELIPYYTERNGYRMPNYHRLDVGLTLDGKKTKEIKNAETGETQQVPKKFLSSWNISVYNAYARENAYSITFRPNEQDPTKTEAVQTTLFKIVPSISYNFKF